MSGFENEPVYEILPPIPYELRWYLLAAITIFFVMFYLSAKAAQMKVSLPWLCRYWAERVFRVLR